MMIYKLCFTKLNKNHQITYQKNIIYSIYLRFIYIPKIT